MCEMLSYFSCLSMVSSVFFAFSSMLSSLKEVDMIVSFCFLRGYCFSRCWLRRWATGLG